MTKSELIQKYETLTYKETTINDIFNEVARLDLNHFYNISISSDGARLLYNVNKHRDDDTRWVAIMDYLSNYGFIQKDVIYDSSTTGMVEFVKGNVVIIVEVEVEKQQI